MNAKNAVRLMRRIGNGDDVNEPCGLLDHPDLEVR